jgi:hypothetical protein
MKKLILLSCLFSLTSIAVFAQLPSFDLGLKGGLNFSKLNNKDDLTDHENITGYQVGIWSRLGGAGVYVQPELYLGSKGNVFKQATGGAEGEVKFTTLDLPILLGSKIGPSKFNVHFMAGPVISFIVNEETTFDSGFTSVTDYNNYKNQTLGLQAGAGLDIGGITLDLRYEAGLSNVSESPKYEQKQNLWHLSFGFKLF